MIVVKIDFYIYRYESNIKIYQYIPKSVIMTEISINVLISLSYILVGILAFHVLSTFFIIEKEINKSSNDIIIFYSNTLNKLNNVEKKINDRLDDIEEKQKLFESNTKKSVDKRIGIFENFIENIKTSINGLFDNTKQIESNLNSLREKNKITIEKNKSIEERISYLNSNMEILKNKQTTTSENNNKTLESNSDNSNQINLLEQKINLHVETLGNLTELIEKYKLEHFNEIKSYLEKVQLVERQIKQIFGKINSIEKNNSSIGTEINLLGVNIQKLSDEINSIDKTESISENISEITTSSTYSTVNLTTQTNKGLSDENSVQSVQSVQSIQSAQLSNLVNEDDLYEKYNRVQREHYIKKITNMILEEKTIIQQHKEIEIKFKTKYPTKPINCPHGFNTVVIDGDGHVKDCRNTLHLLTYNYLNSKKLIEIIFCKYFFKYLDLELNFNYYVNNRPTQNLNIIRFDVKNEIPIFKEDCVEYIEIENECLKGIYYVMLKRKKVLERFNHTYSKLV